MRVCLNVEKPFGAVLKELFHNGTPRTPSTAAWGMRYTARTLLFKGISSYGLAKLKLHVPFKKDSWS